MTSQKKYKMDKKLSYDIDVGKWAYVPLGTEGVVTTEPAVRSYSKDSLYVTVYFSSIDAYVDIPAYWVDQQNK